jgi:hypothetical protein
MEINNLNTREISVLVNRLLNITNLSQTDIEKCVAYSIVTEKTVSELKDIYIKDSTVSEGSKEYLVLTEEEADDTFVALLDDYIESEILPQIPQHLHYYFDDNSFTNDHKTWGRGNHIATYDGDELEVSVNNTQYYVYRLN